MSDEERNAIEEEKFEVEELDESQLEDAAGGGTYTGPSINYSACNESQCG
jgi:hypothetical protein